MATEMTICSPSLVVVGFQREELFPFMIMLFEQEMLVLPLEEVPFTVVEADLLHVS